jgi:DNA-binding MarR family transcriptional regulator
MVRDALVKREEHPRDRRQTVLLLTAKGRALWRKISPRYEAGVEEVFGALPPARRRRFLDDFKTLHDALLAGEKNAESDSRWHAHFSQPKEAA